jgi:hypothetical protein
MGTYIQTDIEQVIKGTTFWTDKERYVYVKLDRKQYAKLMRSLSLIKDEYVEVIYDRNELTVIVKKSTWDELLKSPFTPLADIIELGLITCDVIESTVTGYLLTLLQTLSPNNIGVFVQGAYTTDHIFVEYKDLDKALELLERLKRKL